MGIFRWQECFPGGVYANSVLKKHREHEPQQRKINHRDTEAQRRTVAYHGKVNALFPGGEPSWWPGGYLEKGLGRSVGVQGGIDCNTIVLQISKNVILYYYIFHLSSYWCS